MAEVVRIVDYDSRWPELFAGISNRVARTLGAFAQRIEHVGSTAVPGLPAKPIIDVDIVINSSGDLPIVIDRLRELGYRHEGDLGIPGRDAFIAPVGTYTHHLYVCVAGSAELGRHLAFRDFLRTRPRAAREYGELKRSLAAQFGADREAYSQAKTAFVEQALAQASG